VGLYASCCDGCGWDICCDCMTELRELAQRVQPIAPGSPHSAAASQGSSDAAPFVWTCCNPLCSTEKHTRRSGDGSGSSGGGSELCDAHGRQLVCRPDGARLELKVLMPADLARRGMSDLLPVIEAACNPDLDLSAISTAVAAAAGGGSSSSPAAAAALEDCAAGGSGDADKQPGSSGSNQADDAEAAAAAIAGAIRARNLDTFLECPLLQPSVAEFACMMTMPDGSAPLTIKDLKGVTVCVRACPP
jgi:hypothetical protein